MIRPDLVTATEDEDVDGGIITLDEIVAMFASFGGMRLPLALIFGVTGAVLSSMPSPSARMTHS